MMMYARADSHFLIGIYCLFMKLFWPLAFDNKRSVPYVGKQVYELQD